MHNLSHHNGTHEIEGCDPKESFFPCSDNLYGNIILMIFYGYVLGRGANLIADGSELLLDILNPGLIGGLVLPLLGALPDAMIVILSSLSGSRESLIEEMQVGMGTLAGSTVMLLTIAWGGSVFLGRCDFSPSGKAIDKTLTHKWYEFTKTGVTCQSDISIQSRIMIITALSYVVILVISLISFGRDLSTQYDFQEEFALFGFVLCSVFFIGYSLWSVFNKSIQEKFIEAAQEKVHHENVKKIIQTELSKAEEKLAKEEDQKTRGFWKLGNVINEDANDNHQLNLDEDSHVHEDNDEAETFLNNKGESEGLGQGAGLGLGMTNIVKETIAENTEVVKVHDDAKKVLRIIEKQIEHPEEEDEDDEDAPVLTKKQILVRAPLYMIFGAAVLAVFSDPMVKSITSFSEGVGLEPFYVSFVVAPFATNASELIASLLFAMKKKKKNISLTFGAIYGAVIMNSTFILGLFLGFFYFRQVVFTFYAEVISILFVIIVMGALTSFKTTFSTAWAFPVLSLYPLSIVLVYLLKTYLPTPEVE
eukprot:TRINITY_DN5592_c0_g1_i2.p1 TRINITY_DN5592_c0_g1~~TRINITY_DN5592_c0_g1_i2.p1  ORF type:complete len:534 (+),score=118.79 TRINITY_DN5592_c0_g1_i2:18-1619(+)